MKLKNIYAFYVCLLLICLISVSAFVRWQFLNNKDIIVSPLPDFLTVFANNQVATLNLWTPVFETYDNQNMLPLPIISAKSALIYDLTSQKVLFSKNPQEKLQSNAHTIIFGNCPLSIFIISY